MTPASKPTRQPKPHGFPLTTGRIHFIGIGGIGMSGIAEILCDMGYTITGSDMNESTNIARLRKKGIAITIGHSADNIEGAGIVVISTAIPPSNPEVIAARKQFLPIVHRAEMLGELMRLKKSIAIAGTHGKTTTTSMVASVLDAGGLDPTVINGGIIMGWGSNARLGASEWMVVEADESDGSFARLKPTVAVVTNIDPEHLDHHGDFDSLRHAFRDFISAIPFYGFASLCIDHPIVQHMIAEIPERRLLTYGFSASADVRGVNVRHDGEGMVYDVAISQRLGEASKNKNENKNMSLTNLRLPMLGEHNVLNSLAAICVGLELGLDADAITKGITDFPGVGRRFDHKGEGAGIAVIDDYGHHPVEITAVLAATRMLKPTEKVIAVFQPHRYTRLRDLFADFCGCFNDADHVLIAHVYAAGEEAIDGVSRDHLIDGLRAHGHPSVAGLDDPKDLAGLVLEVASPGDVVLCLGAGTITKWAEALPKALEHYASKTSKPSTKGKKS
ncbi:MAG: UDP-N-acetylmuramate--L-alanine ligase [Proteobacteria bacterium]|nr:UDP-N-acetylmuramate--L-alanine ligase [Pseudomonadota bacterium]